MSNNTHKITGRMKAVLIVATKAVLIMQRRVITILRATFGSVGAGLLTV